MISHWERGARSPAERASSLGAPSIAHNAKAAEYKYKYSIVLTPIVFFFFNMQIYINEGCVHPFAGMEQNRS